MPKLPGKGPKPDQNTPLPGNDEFAPAAEPESKPPAAKKAPAKKPAAKATAPAPGGATREPETDLGLGFAPLTEVSETLNVLLYGREGTTKTTSLALAANLAPEGSRVLVINAEGGLKIAALRKRGVDVSKIVVWPAPNSGVNISYKTLLELHETLHAQLMDNPTAWYLIGIDSITDIVEELRGHATANRIDRAMRNPTIVDKSQIDPDFVDRADYGVMTNQLRDWLRDMRDLPTHLVVTALERYDEETKMTGPAVSPALANSLMGYVDVAGYMRATLHAPGEDDDQTTLAEVRALTRPGKATRAKDRFDLLPRVLAEPTFPRIAQYVSGALVEESDPIQQAYVERRAAELAEQAAAEAEKAERKAAKATPKKAAAKRPAA